MDDKLMYNVHPPMISLTHINSVSTPAVDFNVIVGKFDSVSDSKWENVFKNFG